MVLTLFIADRLINTKKVKNGKSVNAVFIVYALAGFLKILKQMRPQVVEEG